MHTNFPPLARHNSHKNQMGHSSCHQQGTKRRFDHHTDEQTSHYYGVESPPSKRHPPIIEHTIHGYRPEEFDEYLNGHYPMIPEASSDSEDERSSRRSDSFAPPEHHSQMAHQQTVMEEVREPMQPFEYTHLEGAQRVYSSQGQPMYYSQQEQYPDHNSHRMPGTGIHHRNVYVINAPPIEAHPIHPNQYHPSHPSPHRMMPMQNQPHNYHQVQRQNNNHGSQSHHPQTLIHQQPEPERASHWAPNGAEYGNKLAPVLHSAKMNSVFQVKSHIILLEMRTVNVTEGELRRRIEGPEKMDLKMIGKVTRHARTSFKCFKAKLGKSGITVEDNPDSKRIQPTLAMIMEEDAIRLASDFNKLLCFEISKDILAAIVAASDGSKYDHIKEHAERITEYLSGVREYLLCAGRVPSDCVKPTNINDYNAVNYFSNMTHGFGPLAASYVIDQICALVKQIGSGSPSKAAIEKEMQPLDLSSLSKEDSIVVTHQPDDDVKTEPVAPRIGYDEPPIEVTRGELRRRAYGPEHLGVCQLVAFMRKTKKKDTVVKFREQMEQIGIVTKEKAKRGILTNAWISLTEEESMNMALNTALWLSELPCSQSMRNATKTVPGAIEGIRFLCQVLRSAIERVGEKPGQRKIETAADLHLLKFAMLTHHFGHTFICAVLQWLQESIDEAARDSTPYLIIDKSM